MSSASNRFASITRRLEDLPSDGGQTVDALAGANLRIFVRLNALEAELARVSRRLTALEGGTESTKAGNGATPPDRTPSRPTGSPPDSLNGSARYPARASEPHPGATIAMLSRVQEDEAAGFERHS
jgi:hypothetical protein